MKKILTIIATLSLIAVILFIGMPANSLGAADHLDAPAITEDGRVDINDLYIFQSPTNPDNSVMIMTVSPLAGVQNPTTFRRTAEYQFIIDNDGDAREETTYRVHFGDPEDSQGGEQRITVRLPGNRLIAKGWTNEVVPMNRGGMVWAGLVDDPFFFDLVAFQNGLNFCPDGEGTDFFAGLDVLAIVIEVPSSELEGDNGDNIGLWGRTRIGKKFDRMGRPAINTVLIPTANKDSFNNRDPELDQQKYRGDVVNTLLALGNDQATAEGLADFLLPDILTFNTASTDGFPNGRRLADDVIDIELGLITGGAVPSDCVDSNDAPFSNEFPYLAPANQ